jgi:hypothetical protein
MQDYFSKLYFRSIERANQIAARAVTAASSMGMKGMKSGNTQYSATGTIKSNLSLNNTSLERKINQTLLGRCLHNEIQDLLAMRGASFRLLELCIFLYYPSLPLHPLKES